MKGEKILLLTVFTLFFVLSSLLMAVMIQKDMITENLSRGWINQPPTFKTPENNWPKVEIQTGK